MLPNEVVIDLPNSVILLQTATDNFNCEKSTGFKVSSRCMFKTIKSDSYFEAPAKPRLCTQVAAFKTDFTDLHH